MINPYVLGIASLMVGWFLIAKESRDIVAGKAYRATFLMPDGMPTFPSEAVDLFPQGAGITAPEGSRNVTITFVAPRSAVMTDVKTPLGTLKLVSLKEMG